MTADQPQRPEPRENWDWHTSDDQPQRPEPRTPTGQWFARVYPHHAAVMAQIEAEARTAERTEDSEAALADASGIIDRLLSERDKLFEELREARAAERTERLDGEDQ